MSFTLEHILNILFYIDILLLLLSSIVTVALEEKFILQKVLMFTWIGVTCIMAILVAIL